MPSLYAKQSTYTITADELAACRRVADYFRRTALPYLADMYADRNEVTETYRKSIYTPFVEFYLTFYPGVVHRFDKKLVQGIRDFAAGDLKPQELKAIADEYIEAHTVVWVGGVPIWKVDNLK